MPEAEVVQKLQFICTDMVTEQTLYSLELCSSMQLTPMVSHYSVSQLPYAVNS